MIMTRYWKQKVGPCTLFSDENLIEFVAAILDALQQLTVSDADDANSGQSANSPLLSDY